MTKRSDSSVFHLMNKAKNAGHELADGIEALRARVVALKEERASIEGLSVTKEIAFQRVDDWVEGLIAQSQSRATSPDRFLSNSKSWRPSYNVEDTFFAYLGGPLAEAIKSRVSHLYAEDPGISADDRSARIETIDRQILDAELAEESIIRAAETAGFPIMRRADANPNAVLAHQSVLP